MRNIGADVAVGDWVVPSDDGERVEHVLERRSAFTRRASFDGMRAVSHTLAANIDVVFLVHALGSPPSPRRLERELVLAYDSGADPVVVLTKTDLVPISLAARAALVDVALGVPVLLASGISGDGLEAIRSYAAGNRTLTFLGASGVGKSTLVNALLGNERQATSAVREGDQRGRHTTVAAELVPLPGEGWLIDTPGVRALSLWLSGNGIERAFADVFDLMDSCRFRDCKHDQEPGCAVQAAIADGRPRAGPAAQPRAARRGGGGARGGAAGPRQDRRQAVRRTDPGSRAERVRRVRPTARPNEPISRASSSPPTGSRTSRR